MQHHVPEIGGGRGAKVLTLPQSRHRCTPGTTSYYVRRTNVTRELIQVLNLSMRRTLYMSFTHDQAQKPFSVRSCVVIDRCWFGCVKCLHCRLVPVRSCDISGPCCFCHVRETVRSVLVPSCETSSPLFEIMLVM